MIQIKNTSMSVPSITIGRSPLFVCHDPAYYDYHPTYPSYSHRDQDTIVHTKLTVNNMFNATHVTSSLTVVHTKISVCNEPIVNHSVNALSVTSAQSVLHTNMNVYSEPILLIPCL